MTPQERKVMEQALEGGGLYEITGRIEDIDKCIVHRSVIKEALMSHSDGAQPAVPQGHEQEPVEDLQAKLKWATEKLEANINWEFVAAAKEEMLKAAWAEIKELREQEPVGKIVDCDFVGNSIARFERHLPCGTLLYTFPPPQRPSRSDIKPLTNEQVAIIYKAWQAVGADIRGLSWGNFVKEIALHEAAHGIKSGTDVKE